MSRKVAYNILVTDHHKIEWVASEFISECRSRSGMSSIGKDVRWITPPKWEEESKTSIKMKFCRCELEKEWLNLYCFPEAIKRDFWLDALALNIDGALLIVDLGAKRFWDNQINRKKSDSAAHEQSSKSTVLAKRDPHIIRRLTEKEALTLWASRLSAFGDPTRIWGIELVNQINGAKLVLAIKSSPDCVPVSYIRKYLYLDSVIDVIVREVDYDLWSNGSGSYTDEIIRDTLSTLGQKVRRK